MTDTLDPYYGLLTEPPGSWVLSRYGNTMSVMLKGSREFLRRGFNMLSSFGGGKTEDRYSHNVTIGCRHLSEDTWMVPITEARLHRALNLYFYVSMARSSDPTLTDEVLTTKSRALGVDFYTHLTNGTLNVGVQLDGLQPSLQIDPI